MSMCTVGGIDLYYEEHGSGFPLLLIMGLAADSQAWMFQVPDLAPHYRVISFDNRGVGRSSKPAGPYTIAGMADDAAGLLHALGVERAHVVGVSMGGMIAQELVLRHPARVRGLVLGCTYPEPDAEIHRTREQSITDLGGSFGTDGEVQLDFAKIDPMTVFQSLMPRVFTPAFLMSDLPTLMQLFGGALQWGISMDAIFAQAGAAMAHRTSDRLPQITAPTLVITGDADLLIPPSNSDILARAIPNARLVKIPGGSHGFNFETPKLFNQEVLAFLRDVDSRS